MYIIELSFIIFLTIFLLVYNPLLTVVFIKQRGVLDKIPVRINSRLFLVVLFLLIFFGQFLIQFIIPDPIIGLLIYFITITILVIWDKIVKKKRS